MSALLDIYMKIETLETLVKTLKAKNQNGIGVTISISDEINNYGQNVVGFVSQSKEDREAKKNRFFVGNGKVFWTDGKIVKAEAKQEAKVEQADQDPIIPEKTDDDLLPF